MAYKKASWRKAQTSTLGEAIESMLDTYQIKGKMSEAQIIASWERLMGQPIAQKTSEIFLKEKILFVRLSSASLKSELNFSKSKIITMLNQQLGQEIIKELKFL
jgi:predicted nucleic acid-binding Zn ribbon protein